MKMKIQVDQLARIAKALVIACIFLHIPQLTAQSKRLVTAEDLMSEMKHIGQLQLSSDGRTLAYTVVGEDSLWLLDTETKQARALGNGFIPQWSPDGTRLAFYSIRSGTPQLWMFDLKRSTPVQITNFEGGINPDPVARLSGSDEEPLSYSWSPDGTRIVFTSRLNPELHDSRSNPADQGSVADSHKGKPLVLTRTTPPSWTLRGLFRFNPDQTGVGSRGTGSASEADLNQLEPVEPNQLFIVDVQSNKLVQLTTDDYGYFSPAWSPNGKKLACVSNEARPMTGYGPDTTNIYSIDVLSGNRTVLTHSTGQKRLPSWSSDGQQIAYLAGKQFELFSLYVLPQSGGEPQNITQRLDRDIQSFQWGPRGSSIFLNYHDGVTFPIARISLPSAEMVRLTHEDFVYFQFTLSGTGKIVWVESNGSTSGVLYEAGLDCRNAVELLDLNPHIREWALGKQEVVRWKNSRGEELEGILIKPVGYKTGKSYPLIVDPYPGLPNGFMGYLMIGNQAFASRGYAVFFSHERTAHTWWNPFKGKSFNEATRGPQGPDIMMDDLISGIDTVVKMGIADPDRMCLYGFSNGGGATNMIVTRTTRFKCAVSASAAANDLTSQFFLLGDPETYAKEAGGRTPWNDPEAFVELSPVYHLDKVTTRMLFAAGDQETAGTLINLEMYTGLRYLGRDVTFLRYPDQGHGFTGEALKDYWQRVNAFFDKYLRPEQRLN